MSATAVREITITLSGDVTGVDTLVAATNTTSPASITLHTLASGANTITAPTGATLQGATIVPPAGNLLSLTLKGVTGDTGVPLHLTDPTSLALPSTSTTFVLTAGGIITGLRIFWT